MMSADLLLQSERSWRPATRLRLLKRISGKVRGIRGCRPQSVKNWDSSPPSVDTALSMATMVRHRAARLRPHVPVVLTAIGESTEGGSTAFPQNPVDPLELGVALFVVGRTDEQTQWSP